MREKLNELEQIHSITEVLTKNEETSDVVQTVIHVEMMAVGCHLIDKNINLFDAWSLLTGYDEPIIPTNVDKKIIARLRILFSRFVGQSYWEKEIEKYREVPRKYRLIDISNQGSLREDETEKERKNRLINSFFELVADYGFLPKRMQNINEELLILGFRLIKLGTAYLPAISRIYKNDVKIRLFSL